MWIRHRSSSCAPLCRDTEQRAECRTIASRSARQVLWLAALALASLPAPAEPVHCLPHPAAAPAVARLSRALTEVRFVAYEPTALQVIDGHFTSADAASIRADLAALRPKFDALITYDVLHGAEQIPAVAAALGFRALIIGVWDPTDEKQLAAALAAARQFPQLIAGISLGNESLFAQRSNPATLAAVLARVRERAPAVPLSTTEPFHIYYRSALEPLLAQLDFVLVNVHPIFQPWFKDAPDSAAAAFVVNVLRQLGAHACGPIVVKETGVPSAPASSGFTPARQAAFYVQLRQQLPPSATRAFAYFAAFDAPWRAFDATGVPGAAGVHPEEAHWGLFDAERRPKQAALQLPPLAISAPPGR